MAVLGKIADVKPQRREDEARILAAAFFALGVHLLFFQLMMFKQPIPLDVEEDFIAVELVTLPPNAPTFEPVSQPPEIDEAPLPPPPSIKPKPKVAPSPTASVINDAPNILFSN